MFTDYDIAISASGFVGGPSTQKHICQAVLQSRVKWFFSWQVGVDYDVIGKGSAQPLFDEQLEVRETLRRQSEVKWTLVSTGIFASFFFDKAFGVVDLHTSSGRDKVTALGNGRIK